MGSEMCIRDSFDLDLTALIPWVLAQNIGAALFSIPAGWVADRLGVRVVLRTMLFVVCVIPLAALGLALQPEAGKIWYTLVFGMLGMASYLDNKELNRSGISRWGRLVPWMVGFANFTIHSTHKFKPFSSLG